MKPKYLFIGAALIGVLIVAAALFVRYGRPNVQNAGDRGGFGMVPGAGAAGGGRLQRRPRAGWHRGLGQQQCGFGTF